MQVTVFSHDPDGTVSLVTDEGRRLRAPAGAVDPTLRLLRAGQRLSVAVDPTGEVTRLWLPGLDGGSPTR